MNEFGTESLISKIVSGPSVELYPSCIDTIAKRERQSAIKYRDELLSNLERRKENDSEREEPKANFDVFNLD